MGKIPRQALCGKSPNIFSGSAFPLPSSSGFPVWISGLWGMLSGIPAVPISWASRSPAGSRQHVGGVGAQSEPCPAQKGEGALPQLLPATHADRNGRNSLMHAAQVQDPATYRRFWVREIDNRGPHIKNGRVRRLRTVTQWDISPCIANAFGWAKHPVFGQGRSQRPARHAF